MESARLKHTLAAPDRGLNSIGGSHRPCHGRRVCPFSVAPPASVKQPFVVPAPPAASPCSSLACTRCKSMLSAALEVPSLCLSGQPFPRLSCLPPPHPHHTPPPHTHLQATLIGREYRGPAVSHDGDRGGGSSDAYSTRRRRVELSLLDPLRVPVPTLPAAPVSSPCSAPLWKFPSKSLPPPSYLTY